MNRFWHFGIILKYFEAIKKWKHARQFIWSKYCKVFRAVAFFFNWILSQLICHLVSVQFSHSVVSNSLWPHEPQHARPPCPSPTAGAYSNPCPLSRWCHPTISSSVVSFSSCLQSFPASGSSQMSKLFTSGGQSIGVSASTSVLPMNTQLFIYKIRIILLV